MRCDGSLISKLAADANVPTTSRTGSPSILDSLPELLIPVYTKPDFVYTIITYVGPRAIYQPPLSASKIENVPQKSLGQYNDIAVKPSPLASNVKQSSLLLSNGTKIFTTSAHSLNSMLVAMGIPENITSSKHLLDEKRVDCKLHTPPPDCSIRSVESVNRIEV